MGFSNDLLNDIYDRSDGRCHICGSKRAFQNYGLLGGRGGWEVDHSTPVCRGGSDRRNNLYVACHGCNRSKGGRSTRSIRRVHGLTRAPSSRRERKEDDALDSLGKLALVAVGFAAAQAFAKRAGAVAPSPQERRQGSRPYVAGITPER